MTALRSPRKKLIRTFEFDEKILLIKQVRSRPVLWDINKKNHFHSVHLRKAWESVASSLNKDMTSCKAAWRSLRDSHRYYCKSMRKKEVSRNRSNGGWRLAQHLDFLPKEFGGRRQIRSPYKHADREKSESVDREDSESVDREDSESVDREDSESAAERDDDCDETASQEETELNSFIDDVKHMEKDLSNWTEDLYSSVGKIREKKDPLSPTKEDRSSHQHQATFSRPIFAYWESLLNKMSPEAADSAEQQMTQALWAESAALKYKDLH